MNKLKFFLLLPLLIVACASREKLTEETPKKEASKDLKKIYQDAKKSITSGKKTQGYKKMRLIQKESQGTDIEGGVYFSLAEEAFEKKNWVESADAYLRAAKAFSKNEDKLQACLKATESQRKVDLSRALKMNQVCSDYKGWALNEKKKILANGLDLQNEQGDVLSALRTLKEIESLAGLGEAEKAQLRSDINNKINFDLGLKDLESIARDEVFRSERSFIYLRIAQAYLAQGDANAEALSWFEETVNLNPESAEASVAREQLLLAAELKAVNPATIGVILPLTGKQAAIGQRTLKGLQFGLGILPGVNSPITLSIMDSEANPDVARRGVERLVREDNVIAIAGSLLSKTSASVASQAHNLKVPSISMAQKEHGFESSYVFRNALTTSVQVKALVAYAMDVLGLRTFAIMYPNDSFGVEYANIFWDEVLARGGQIRGSQIYDPNETDFRKHIERLTGTFYVEDRREEWSLLSKKWLEENKNKSARGAVELKVPDDLLPAVLDFEALFVADTVRALGQIAPMLSYYNVKGIKLLGPNVWNTPQIIKRLGGALQNQVVFMDQPGLAVEGGEAFSPIAREYKRIYKEEPGAFEIQGIETGLLIRGVLAKGVKSRDEFAASLRNLGGVRGLAGDLSINANNQVEKRLQAFSVVDGSISALTPEKSVR